MASNAVAAREGLGFFPPTEKSSMLFMATAASGPLRMRGSEGPIAIARNGESFAAAGRFCRERLSHPSSVIFLPGVPDSIKSWASKCERVESGDPAA